jgi:SMC interacting uncharacterized protein involved in chromosome segregation
MNNNNYEQALKTLSAMAEDMERKNKIIETLAWKVDVLSKVVLKAGINIDDYLSIEEVAQYPKFSNKGDE